MIFLETTRLMLRSLSDEDAEYMYDYRNHPRCSRYQRGQTKTLAGIQRLIQEHKEDVITVSDSWIAAVSEKQSGELIGEIVVMPNDGTITLGYTISYRYHRKGYAYEALYALIQLLHEKYPAWDFISFTDPENEASKGLLLKLGYRNMGYVSKVDSLVFGKWTSPETEKEIAAATNKQ